MRACEANLRFAHEFAACASALAGWSHAGQSRNIYFFETALTAARSAGIDALTRQGAPCLSWCSAGSEWTLAEISHTTSGPCHPFGQRRSELMSNFWMPLPLLPGAEGLLLGSLSPPSLRELRATSKKLWQQIQRCTCSLELTQSQDICVLLQTRMAKSQTAHVDQSQHTLGSHGNAG